jgi:aldehyde dehydrogenase (NAD+)
VFSKNYTRAEKIAHSLVTGMSNVNDFGVNYLCQGLPFGGVKVCIFLKQKFKSSHLLT